MKKLIYKVTAFVCVSIAATSCLSDVLETESQKFDASVVYSNYTLAEYSIFGIANACGETNSYRGRIDLWYGFNTDIELYKSGSNTSDNWGTDSSYQLAEYNTLIGNGNMNIDKGPYAQMVSAIERANICIEGLSTYADLHDPDMNYLYGEALTWRAFLYMEMVKMWGEVPLRTSPVSNETLYIPSVDRDLIYDQILEDLENAIPRLYEPFKATQTQSSYRVNKVLAIGLYARAVLAATGWSWRPDDGQVGTGNYGSLRLSTSSKYSGEGKKALCLKALEYLKSAMTMGSSLEASYEQLWRKFNNSEHMYSPEVLWIRPFSDGRGRWNYTHGVPHTAGSEYFSAVGKDRGGATGPIPTLWWKYEKEDVRRDITCVPWDYYLGTDREYTRFGLRGGVNYWFWGKYRFEWMINKPYAGGDDDGIKPIIMRYSDILLMASELAAYNGDLADAQNYLLEVRKRAYVGNENMASAYVNGLTLGNAGADDAAIKDYNTDNTIMKAIIDERALEFAGEMLRKQDLIRWGLLKIKMDEASEDLKKLANMEAPYDYYASGSRETSDSDLGTISEYRVYWRVNDSYPSTGHDAIEIFGLEKDEVGKTPADYSELEPNGWVNVSFISKKKFYNSKGGFRYDVGFYRNDKESPWPRSVWPHFAKDLTNAQNSLVNDYDY